MRIAIVGAGNLGGAVAAGLVASGAVDVRRAALRHAHRGGRQRLRARPGLADVGHARTRSRGRRRGPRDARREAVRVLDLLRELGPVLAPGVTLVSLAAGVRSPSSSRRTRIDAQRRAADDQHAGAGPCRHVAHRRAPDVDRDASRGSSRCRRARTRRT
jgi:hypothetical protein